MKKSLELKYYIPLFATVPVILACVIIIITTLNSDGASYAFDWLDFGGTFKYTDIHLFGISLQNILMIIGLAICIYIAIQKKDQYGFYSSGASLATIVFFLFSYLGAKLLSAIEEYFANGVWDMTGQSLFGVLYISLPAVPFMALVFKKKVSDMFDFCAPTFASILAFIRIGCYLSGCCGAKQMQWGDSPVILPVQLFEVIFDFVILFLCLVKDRPQEHKQRGRGIWPFMLIVYCSTRFILEFLRSSKVYFLGFSLGQIYSMVFIIIGVVWYCYIWEQESKNSKKKIIHKKRK